VNTTALGSITNIASGNSSLTLQTGSSPTTAVTINTSQNVGIGTASPSKKFVVSSAGANGFEISPNDAGTGTNRFFTYNRSTSAYESMYLQALNFIFGSGSSVAEAMRINSSGNVLVGNTTQPTESQVRQLLSTSSSTYLQFARTATTLGGSLIGTSGQNFIVQTYTGDVGGETYTERMRINSSGELLVGNTTNLEGGKFDVSASGRVAGFTINASSGSQDAINVANQASATYNAFRFWTGGVVDVGTLVGRINCTTSATSYVTSSDYRLKDNIAPMTGALAKVSQLKPCTYTWKIDGSSGQGFIAHELSEVVPECVNGEKDAVNEDGLIDPQGIDTSFLVATLTAAIQELKAINDTQAATINALTARIVALENR
jgi:hypothetical protein